MSVIERDPGLVSDPLDRDDPTNRAVVARMLSIQAGQLTEAAADVTGSHATPWQCSRLLAMLDRLRGDVSAVRRECARLAVADRETGE